jgi:uroporphyrinogen-III decarboxylase
MCGEIGRVIDLIAAASFDGIIDVAPPPTGDCDFRSTYAKLARAGKCLAGGIDCTAFVNLLPAQVEAYVRNRLAEVAPGTGFLMGSGDAVPFGTPVENLRAVVRVLEECGTYPLENYKEL